MIIEPNVEIIRQLYKEMSSQRDTIKLPDRRKSFTQYTLSSKPSNLKAFKNFFIAVSSAFPDYELSIESMIVKGDKVMVRYTISGTHRGVFMGMEPTHERLTVKGIDIFRLDNGKIVEHWDAAHQVCAMTHSNLRPNVTDHSLTRNDISDKSGRKLFSLSS